MQERRRTQEEHGPEDDLGVAVGTPGGRRHAGRIVRVSSERLTLAFPVHALPDLGEGSRVKLLFRTLRGGELTAQGRMVEEGGLRNGDRLFDFCFEATSRPSPGAAPADPSPESPSRSGTEEAGREDGENRREAYRVQPEKDSAELVVRPYGDPRRSLLRQLVDLRVDGNRRTVRGSVFDVSVDGIGILIEEEHGLVFEVGDHVDLSFHLPDLDDPLLVGAHVVHRLVLRIGIRYGLCFDRGSTAHFQRIQAEILEFVMRRQRENLRGRAG